MVNWHVCFFAKEEFSYAQTGTDLDTACLSRLSRVKQKYLCSEWQEAIKVNMNIKNNVYCHQLHSWYNYRLKEKIEDLEEIYKKVNMLCSIISKFIRIDSYLIIPIKESITLYIISSNHYIIV